MLHFHLQHAQGRPLPVNGTIPVLPAVGGGVLHRQLLDGGALLPVLLQNPDGAEGDDAAEVGGVLLRDNVILVDDTEGGPGAAPNGVHLVARFGGVEVNLPVRVHIAEGDGVGPASVAGQGQHPGGSPLQDCPALLRGQGLLEAAHGTKHRHCSSHLPVPAGNGALISKSQRTGTGAGVRQGNRAAGAVPAAQFFTLLG